MQQQAQSRIKNAGNKHLTPIEKLLADKIDLEEKCRKQEKKLNDDLTYIQNNAASLLLSGVSTLLFPPKNTKKNTTGKQTSITSGIEKNTAKTPLSLSDYFVVAKNLIPVAWNIVQPMIIAWGIKKAKSYIIGVFTGKKSSVVRK